MGEQPAKFQTAVDDRPGHVDHTVGICPGAPLTGVDLDEHVRSVTRTVEGTPELACPLDRVDSDRQPDPTGQLPDPTRLLPDRPHRVGDEHVLDAGVSHHLRLAEHGDGDADGAGYELPMREKGALVGLRVRTKVNAAAIEEGLHPRDVRVDPVEVDDDRRGVKTSGEGRCTEGLVD